MLKFIPAERITAAEALDHKYFQGFTPSAPLSSTPPSSDPSDSPFSPPTMNYQPIGAAHQKDEVPPYTPYSDLTDNIIPTNESRAVPTTTTTTTTTAADSPKIPRAEASSQPDSAPLSNSNNNNNNNDSNSNSNDSNGDVTDDEDEGGGDEDETY